MTSLYLDRRETALKLEGRVLSVYIDGRREGSVPIHLLERIVLRSSVALDSGMLARLADAGVAVIAFGGRFGRSQAIVLGATHNEAARRIGQIRRYDDPAYRQRWSRRIVIGKIRGQRRLLRGALARRPDQRHALTKAVDAQDQALARLLAEPDLGVDQVRGVEGAAAAGFFRGYTHVFAPELDFTGRNRRPPRDPVNAALSLGYSLLHADAARSLQTAGLDPMVGFFHELDFGRASLASDLIEPLRPHVEQWVWECFRERLLRAEDFKRDGEGCLLGKNARQRYFAAFERFARPRRRLLRRWSGKLAAQFAEDGGRRQIE
ncbi:CRISPR-associated endonuclease Cas1 [Thiorhodococcus mannitoliphagus]|uniref:CRISPR-associated endonuclease Cas1 n=1 Tax=Thiorhodococcus mannitoliphagus TaxID=329406 RepID=A0A6P1E336_9GAMM|nr:CRISPR-associated endonuclease Cas1 [Thiorhodococcus mannitoliphagus]NEX22434.1 CRISPR-associated endonuclease Cas1 [Thiorhodococcus mannitoliphagus]